MVCLIRLSASLEKELQFKETLARINCSHPYCIKLFYLGNLFIGFVVFFKEEESLNQTLLGARCRINGTVWILLGSEEYVCSAWFSGLGCNWQISAQETAP